MISAMDDQIGRVVNALEQRKMRENTLIVFESDNGGPRSAKFTGEVDMSKSTIPADNGPWRDGKASLYEGGTRVVSLANWPGHIKAGSVIDQPIHIVDMNTTIAGLGGASAAKGKPRDGLDVWPTISTGAPSPRQEVVYDVEPFLAALRQGDWKLVWKTVLPSRVELFNLARDSGETTNVAAENPEKVAELQRRIEELSREAAPPLFLVESWGAVQGTLFSSVSTPEEERQLEQEP
jgi:arylsulfatase A-like enzyme